MLTLRPFSQGIEAGGLGQPLLLSLHTRVFQTLILAHMLNSLVRVSRREKENHFAKTRSPFPQGVAGEQLSPPFSGKENRACQSRPQRSSRTRMKKYGSTNTGFLRFLSSNFRYSLTLFSKFFASFPHGTCSLSVSHQYFVLNEIYHPFELHSQTTRLSPARSKTRHMGVSPSQLPCSNGLGPARNARVYRPQFGAPKGADSHGEQFPLQSPLLRES